MSKYASLHECSGLMICFAHGMERQKGFKEPQQPVM